MNNFVIAHSNSNNESNIYDQIVSESAQRAPEETIRQIRQFLSIYPSFPQAHNDLGVLYLRTGKATLALAHHEKASRLQPDNITFRKNLADFYAVELGWLEDAIDIYLDILKRNPRDTEALIALGRLGSAMTGTVALEAPPQQQMEIPPPQPAAAPISTKTTPTSTPPPVQPAPSAQQSTTAPPLSSFDDLYRQAHDLAQNGQYAEAAVKLEECLVRQPNNAVIHNDLGVVRYNLGDIAAAQSHYEKAVALVPANAVFARNLADLYFAVLGKSDDAIHIYLDLLNKFPRDVETLINLGYICTAVGHGEEAKSFYRKALEIEPWNNDARRALAADVRPLQPEQIRAVTKRTAEELHAEALRLVSAEQLQDALTTLEELVRDYVDHAIGHNDLGVIRHRLGDSHGAERSYQQAVKLQPENINFQKNLADLMYTELGKTDDAVHIYLSLHQKFPRDIETLLALGQILSVNGHPSEAKNFFRRALEIEPWNKAAREALKSA